MKNGFTKMALCAAALLLSASLAFAADVTVKTPDVKGAAKATAAGAKAAAKSKIVDINTASETELKAVPGIGDTYAAKIVAGRPYANKAQLKSKKIVPDAVYDKVKNLIAAKKIKK